MSTKIVKRVDVVEDDVKVLKEFKTTTEGSIYDINHTLVENDVAITKNTNDITEVNQRITSTNGVVETANSKISTLETQMDNITSFKNVKDFGIVPDGITNWDTNGKLDTALRWASENKFPIYFPKGDYKCPMNNYYSNVTCVFEDGAMFCGTIHVAVNRNSGAPNTERPNNVRFLGVVGTYDRVGTYNCDDIYIEKIKVVSNTTKQMQGRKSAGTHFYLDTKNLRVDEIYVDGVESDYMYAVGIDGNSNFEPKNISIGRIIIKDTNVNGVYLCGENNNIDEIIIEGYGAGSQTRALPMAHPDESLELKGLWVNRAVNCTIGNIVMSQKSGDRPNAKDGVYCDDGVFTISNSIIKGANRTGFRVKAQVESPVVTAGNISVSNCGKHGVSVESGILKMNYISSVDNSENGVYLHTSVGTKGFEITSSRNGLEQLLALADTNLNIHNINVSGGVNPAKNQIMFSGVKKSNIGNISCTIATKGATGGIYMANCEDLSIQRLSTQNCGKDATYCAVRIENGNRVNVLSGFIKDGVGQGLRMVSLSDCNFSNTIIDGHDTNVVGSGLTRCGIMNCVSQNAVTNTTNLSSASATYFNSNTMYK